MTNSREQSAEQKARREALTELMRESERLGLYDKPNPGSDEAIKAGCRCPRMDNAYGRGYLGGVTDKETGETLFVRVGDCPLHGWEAAP
jgi:hypothetical protein